MKKREALLIIVLALILPCVALLLLGMSCDTGPVKPEAKPSVSGFAEERSRTAMSEASPSSEDEGYGGCGDEEEPELISLGEFLCSAYCSCRSCCGKWAENRPVDENGEEIVYTASGAIAQAGVTIAVDTSVIPHGTVVVIDGQEYIAQDTGHLIEGKRIDVYHDDHQAARVYGMQTHEVFVKEVM